MRTRGGLFVSTYAILHLHLSFAGQASLLLNGRMTATQQELMNALEQVGYYRLSAYCFPFRVVDPVTGTRQDIFRPGTSFDTKRRGENGQCPILLIPCRRQGNQRRNPSFSSERASVREA